MITSTINTEFESRFKTSFKKLKNITVTILNTYGEDDIYNDDENPAYINIIADRIDEYK